MSGKIYNASNRTTDDDCCLRESWIDMEIIRSKGLQTIHYKVSAILCSYF